MQEALEKPVKRRDASATKARLLESARLVFTEKGYEGAGLREICGNAGVDLALVKRYFGSKEALFKEIFVSIDATEAMYGTKDNLGQRIVDFWLNKPAPDSEFDATMALLRSIGSHQVNAQLKEVVEEQHINVLAKTLGGKQARQRAALIISQIIGFDVARRVLGVDSMSEKHKRELSDLWSKQIQALVDNK